MLGIVYLFILLVIAVLAFGYKDSEYRITCIVMILGSVLSFSSYYFGTKDWNENIFSILWIDFTAAIAFAIIALRSEKFWPLWVAGMQIGALASHLAAYLNVGAVPYAMGVLQGSWAWVQLLILLAIGLEYFRKIQHRLN